MSWVLRTCDVTGAHNYLGGALSEHLNHFWWEEVSILRKHVGAAVLNFSGEMADFEAQRISLGRDVETRLDVAVEFLCGGQ